jgi:hypothetical protein
LSVLGMKQLGGVRHEKCSDAYLNLNEKVCVEG